ncbi:MAG: hypothetical protein AAGA68_26515 [Pseudomonadota bacterium]
MKKSDGRRPERRREESPRLRELREREESNQGRTERAVGRPMRESR